MVVLQLLYNGWRLRPARSANTLRRDVSTVVRNGVCSPSNLGRYFAIFDFEVLFG